MKIIFLKRIVFFKIKNNKNSFQKVIVLKNSNSKNIILYIFGLYFKLFFDIGLNVFGMSSFFLYKIMNHNKIGEFFFFKFLTIKKKTSRLFEIYNSILTQSIKSTKQGFFIEFKVIGYFRAKRICVLRNFKKGLKKKVRFIILYFGQSHAIFVNLNIHIKFIRGKKRFLFFTLYKQDFNVILSQMFVFKPFNVYKNKGLKTSYYLKKMKPGKQKQQKKTLKK